MSQTAPASYPALKLQAAKELPPMGPPWWGAVMGSGILATLIQAYWGANQLGQALAVLVLLVAWLIMLSWTAAFVVRIVASPAVFAASFQGVGMSAWGMVAMGILSVGSATFNILPALLGRFGAVIATQIDIILWTVGTVLGLFVALGFTINLLKHRPAEPRPAWALAVVPPMVSATTGTALASLLPTPLAAALLTVLMACFCITITLAFIVLYAALDHHLRISVIPAQLAVTSFIPLGPVGQSTAAAQAIAGRAETMLLPAAIPTVHTFANIYGSVMLVASLPLLLLALGTVIKAIKNGMTFTPTWWASTFPVGTVALGAHYVAEQPGFELVNWYGILTLLLLLCTWLISLSATIKALLLKR